MHCNYICSHAKQTAHAIEQFPSCIVAMGRLCIQLYLQTAYYVYSHIKDCSAIMILKANNTYMYVVISFSL